MKLLGRIVTLVAAIVVPLPAAYAQPAAPQPSESPAPVTWGIVPSGPDGPDGRSAFEYAVDPGTTITDMVGVINYTEKPLTVDVYAHDAARSLDGGFDLLPASEEPSDVGAWVALDEPTVTIPARSRVDLPLRVTVPANATPGDHAGGIVASLTTEAADSAGGQMAVDRRVGARIYLRVSGTLDPALVVSDLQASFDGLPVGTPGTVRVEYTVRNEGNLRLAGRPYVRVAGPFGLGERRAAGEPLPELLPGDSATSSAVISGVWQLGRLDIEVEIQPESSGDQILDPPPRPGIATTQIWVIPWIALVVLLVAIVLGVRLRRIRQIPSTADDQR